MVHARRALPEIVRPIDPGRRSPPTSPSERVWSGTSQGSGASRWPGILRIDENRIPLVLLPGPRVGRGRLMTRVCNGLVHGSVPTRMTPC